MGALRSPLGACRLVLSDYGNRAWQLLGLLRVGRGRLVVLDPMLRWKRDNLKGSIIRVRMPVLLALLAVALETANDMAVDMLLRSCGLRRRRGHYG